MQNKTRSLLEELNSMEHLVDTKLIIERRASNIIASATHLMELIERNYTPEQAAILEKKLLVAIKNRDQGKFSRSLQRTKKDNEDQ